MKLKDYYNLVMKHIHLIIDLKLRNIPWLMKFYGSYKNYKQLTVEFNAEEGHSCR